VKVEESQQFRLVRETYYRIFFSDFLANIGGLSTSIIGAVAFFMSSYHAFAQSQAMSRNLYGHSTDRHSKSGLTRSEDEVNESFRLRLEGRKPFLVSYVSWLFFSRILPYCCCCLKSCCARSTFIKEKIDKYRKFDLALKRLSLE